VGLDLLFLLLWLTGTSFISLSCFLAALSSSASMTTSLYSTQFLVALITAAACSTPSNVFQSVGYNDGVVDNSVCYFVSSSFNRVYSPSLLGFEFVQFLVFFLPWFHAAQAMSDVLSVVQYEGLTVDMSESSLKYPPQELSYSAGGSAFNSKWIQYSLVMLVSSSVL
jgi:hypothetical protein